MTLQVQRVRRNLVRITSDYSRLPVVDVQFMNEVSWAGVRR